jgi:hypothetical protein
VRAADIVVDATANPTFSLLLNDVCLRAERPAIYTASYRRAAIGRIHIVRPGQDACLVCYHDGHVDAPSFTVIPPGDEGQFLEAGCGIPTVEASAVDVEATANWGARLILWLLQGKLGADNLYLIVNDVIADAQGPLAQLGIHNERWQPIAGCEACERVRRQP